MGNVFRVINSNGDIEITMYRKANAVFKTNEYNETDNICTYKEIINIFDLLKENQELKSQLKGTTHCFDEEEHEKLKKQLEEWGHHLKCSKEMLDIQGQKGNYDYDEYMLGLYNGMEYVIALFETREPNYINGKDVEFTNNKIQQKEFIEWLEDEIQQQETLMAENQEKLYFLMYEDEKEDLKLYSRKAYTRRIILEEILQKYKEIIGGKHE
jgi:hypothetical protein